MKKTFSKYLFNKYAVIGVIVIVVILYIFLRNGNSSGNIEYSTAKIGDIIEKVSVTGKVASIEKAELSFEKNGVVRSLPFQVGDHVKRGDMIASLDNASDIASLQSVEAELAEISRGLRPEEYASYEAAVLAASTTLANAKKSALVAMRDSYTKAQGAIVNYTDSLFQNPQSVNPTIVIRTSSINTEKSINDKRLLVTEVLAKWKLLASNPTSINDESKSLADAEIYLDTIKDFTDDLSIIVSDLTTGSSGLTQTTIDTYVTAMNNGLSALNQAISSIATADTALRSARASYVSAYDQFTLQKAGSSPQSIASQSAKVAQARAELEKSRILSPIDGIVTRVDPKLGEFVVSGKVLLAVQSDKGFKIESNVPEADIAKIALNNPAVITLDAYGSHIKFPAIVTEIDPAETILDGVPTYKITLVFTELDPRLRSGMTANIDIITREKKNVLIIPARAISEKAGQKTVRILRQDNKNFDETPVTVGLKGSDGMIEILSGLTVGQKVISSLK